MSFRCQRNDSVGGVENRLRRAIILLQWKHRGLRELQGKVENIPDRGSAKRIDRLSIVPNSGQPLPRRAQPLHDFRLECVCVLVFIHQHAVELLPNDITASSFRHQPMPEQQQIVVIERLLLLLSVRIRSEKLLESVELIRDPGKGFFEDLFQRTLRVYNPAVDIETRPLEREPLVRLGQLQFQTQNIEQVFGVTPVDDGELRS